MTEVSIFQEFVKYPINTVISLMAIVVFLIWWFKERPKLRRERFELEDREHKERIAGQEQAHTDRLRMTEESSATREVMKNQQVVIDNCTAAIKSQTSSNEALRAALEHQASYLHDFKECAHEDHGDILEKTENILTVVQRNEMLIKNKR